MDLLPFWGQLKIHIICSTISTGDTATRELWLLKLHFEIWGFSFVICIAAYVNGWMCVCACVYVHRHALTHIPTHKSLRQQMPHLSCISELKTTKKIKMIQSGSDCCVRKASRIRQLQQNGERIQWTGTIFVLQKIKVRKDIKNINALKMTKEYHIFKNIEKML